MSKPLKIAVAGLGTVGAGLLKLLAANGDLLEKRCGRRLVVTAVSARNRTRDARLAVPVDARPIAAISGGAPAHVRLARKRVHRAARLLRLF